MKNVKARTVAVENFLNSADITMPLYIHMMNLSIDARLYKWNYATVKAIKDALQLKYLKQVKQVKSVIALLLLLVVGGCASQPMIQPQPLFDKLNSLMDHSVMEVHAVYSYSCMVIPIASLPYPYDSQLVCPETKGRRFLFKFIKNKLQTI